MDKEDVGDEAKKFFYEDIVIRKIAKHNTTHRHEFGVVQKVFGSDDSSDEDSDSEEELKNNQIRVAWANGEVEILHADDVKVVDRSLLHGDVVCNINNPLSQAGTVVDVQMLCDISFMNNAVIMKNINSKHLKPLHYFKTGSYGLANDWLCKIESCQFNIAIIFNDGSLCILKRADPDKLLDVEFEDASQAFYPCQSIKFNTKQRKIILSQAHWMKGKYDTEKHKVGTIINIIPVNAELSFIYSVKMSDEPPVQVNLRDIKIFKYFTYSNWSVNDIVKLTDTDEENFLPNPEDYEKQIEDIRPNIVVIDKSKTTVSVEWQNGLIETNLPSIQLQPVLSIGSYDFYPKDFIVNKNDDREERAINHKLGCVQNVNTKERMCKVKWLTDDFGIKLKEEKYEELSIYDILDSKDFSYRLGDVVIKLDASINSDSDWAGEFIEANHEKLIIQWISGDKTHVDFDSVVNLEKIEENFRDDEINPYDIDPEQIKGEDKASEFERELALANRIAQRISGEDDIQLVLPPHLRSRIYPDEQDDEDDQSWDTLSGNSDYDQSWDTVDEEEDDNENQGNNIKERISSDEEEDVLYERGVQDYVRRLLQLSNEMRDRNSKISYKSSSSEYIMANEEEMKQAKNSPQTDCSNQTLSSTETISEELIVEQFECIEMEHERNILEDHHFRNNQFSQNSNRKFVQTIQKEWKILKQHLPGNIFVKVFENRLDLMRVIMIGSSETPYSDGIFVFDIYLPQNYPEVPPILKFFAYNEKLNPNLYENGNICLSLLNTWQANNETEAWCPKSSNILQVLISIQALVLNKQPYFNEANYDIQIATSEGDNNSAIFNENVLLMNVGHMMKMMRHPPRHTSQIVKTHFKHKGSEIIARLSAYISNSNLAFPDLNGLLQPPSQGFIQVLQRTLPKFKALCEGL